jgi:diaminobutyrate-2-oxoglutarate transaminase
LSIDTNTDINDVTDGARATDVIERLESEVRSYCRMWPATFATARGSRIWDVDGNAYLDFFSGAGALNYGHNDPVMKRALLEHLADDGIVHSLDTTTVAKRRFLERFEEVILEPRGLDHKVMFPGPTGTNAVESAMKLARKVTGREQVVGFTNAFHGMTIGSLAVSGNGAKRLGAGVALTSGTSVPYDGYFGDDVDTIAYLDALLADSGSGFEKPAAVIVETVQAEGGINMASAEWLTRLRELCTAHDVLMIVDDIQAGCGRTGPFFSYEIADIEPDIITLSKSLSGFGLPFALLTFRRDLDIFDPGEHNGTFRGSNPAFVTATAALSRWDDDRLERATAQKAAVVSAALDGLVEAYPEHVIERRGRGLLQGIQCAPGIASDVARKAFELGLIVETSGASDEVLKLLPALTIGEEELAEGLGLIATSMAHVVGARTPVAVG